ncbi:MAG: enoyl-CoA hydratase-related protein [Limibacillus sp.]
MPDTVLTEHRDGVLVVTLNRPAKKNAIDNGMWHAIREAFEAAGSDDDVACVLLTGAGDNFCAGVDLSSFGELAQDDAQPPFYAAAETVAAFEKPLVAAAQGAAVGGGATVLFHADIVYAGESLRLRLPFASLGLVPEWASSYMLQANIGAQRAAELFYTAEWVDAARALEAGIAAKVVPDAQLFDHALAKAAEIARWPVTALRETKRCLRLHHRDAIAAAFAAERAGMERQAGSPENLEALAAFMEKRAPDFRGR